jgi:NAD(P)-dependent dehydrogenase (short-subunit alcohol dehydrogenase family)
MCNAIDNQRIIVVGASRGLGRGIAAALAGPALATSRSERTKARSKS